MLLVLAAGGVAAALLYRRRRAGASDERVDLYFTDGSLLALTGEDAEARRLLPFAREILMSAASR